MRLIHPNNGMINQRGKLTAALMNMLRVIADMRPKVVPIWVGARADFSEVNAGTVQVSVLHQRKKSGMSKTSEGCSSSKTRGTSREGTSFDDSSSLWRAIGIWLVRVGNSGSAR